MSRQLEKDNERREASRRLKVVHAMDYGLERAIQGAGRAFYGFTYRHRPGDTLLVLKASKDGTREVAFVGSSSLSEAILKAVREAATEDLVWKMDSYAG